MSNMSIKLLSIYLLSLLLLFSYVVNSENSTDYDSEYSDDEDVKLDNKTESVKSYNTSEDYDYSELNKEDSEGCDAQSFIDKVKMIHEEGKNSTISKNVKHINETFDLLKNVRTVFGNLFGIDEREKLKLYEFLSDIDLRLSPECLSSFLRVFTAIGEADLWALKFLDSMGSFPPKGFADGVLANFGEYDECLSIKSPKTHDRHAPVIKGQYCMLRVILPFPAKNSFVADEPIGQKSGLASKFGNDLKLHQFTIKSMIETLNIVNGTIYRLGVCIPSTCKPKEVEVLLNKLLQPITRLPVEIDERCHTKDEPIILNNFQLISITIFSILLVLVISSTVLEIYSKQNDKKIPESHTIPRLTKAHQYLLSFSIIKNTQLLFAKTPEKWAALDTIRLLLIVYVHIAHIYIVSTTLGLVTVKKIFSMVLPRMFHDSRYFFARNPIMIDALYTLSGFLISYGLLRKLEQSKGRFNYPIFVFQQWARFTILGFGSLLFFYIFPFTGDGPVWDYAVDYATYGCKQPGKLLKILLFVNNFADFNFEDFHETCNLPLWFLSALLQFLIVSPFFIILFYKKPRIGTYVMIALLMICSFATIAPLLFGVKPYLQILIYGAKLLSQNVSQSINWYHTYPNVQAISYFTGVAAGFVMKKNPKITKTQTKTFWTLSVAGIVFLYIWYDSFWKPNEKERMLGAILYHTLGKFAFNVCISWIYFACCTGRGGYVNAFLSWRGFQPIARLSFGIFMLHYLVIAHRVFAVKDVQPTSDQTMWRNIVIDLMLDVIVAYIFYILIECPFSNIFKIIFARKPREKPIELPVEKAINNINININVDS